jgi:hypothetical protein
MNDISKTNIQTKLVKAMAAENIGPSETARIFGIPPNYISMMKNPQAWDKCPKSAWEAVLLWINSGQGLKEYSEKHGKVLPEKKEVEEHSPASVMPEEKDPEQARADHYAHEALKATEIAIGMPAINSEGKLSYENSERKNERTEKINANAQKVIIDIEINLIINGKKIEMK